MSASPTISYSVSRASFLYEHSPVPLFETYFHSWFVGANFLFYLPVSLGWNGSFGKKTIVEIKYNPQFSLGNLLRRPTTYTQAIRNYSNHQQFALKFTFQIDRICF